MANATGIEWRDELKSTLLTRKELGEDMEDEVIESFLARMQRAIDEQVEARVNAASGAGRGGRSYNVKTGRLAIVLCLSIPLLAIAGGIAGTPGILAFVALILVLLLLP